jgi:hypothetical protein
MATSPNIAGNADIADIGERNGDTALSVGLSFGSASWTWQLQRPFP